MKKLIKMSAMLMLSTLLFVACDDDDDDDNPDTVVTVNYYPTTVNDYRVYQNYEVDSEGNKTESTLDSNVVSEQGSHDGNDTYTEKEFEWNEETSTYEDRERDAVYYEEDDVVYASASLIANLSTVQVGGVPVSLPVNIAGDAWVPIINFESNSSWNVYTDNDIVGESLQLNQDLTVEFSQPLSVDGENMGMENIEVNGTQYEALKISWTITSQVTAFSTNADLKVEVLNYYADGIGLVKSMQIPFSIKATVFGNEVGQDFPGNESLLLRYNVQSDAEVN
jgi:hypothetical protein